MIPVEIVDPTIRAVAAGDPIPVRVMGGYIRRPAPSAGLLVETPDDAMFLPLAQVKAAMRGKAL